MGRIPVLTTFRTGDEVQDRNFDHIKQTLNPVLRNPLLAAADFRWMEIAATSATGTPTFALQYRTQETWATILTLTSAGQIVQLAWIAPTLLNSWVNFGAPWENAGYWKDSLGVIHLRGLLKNGVIGSAAFTLPTGYRPANKQRFAQISNAGGADVLGTLDVDSAGSVVPVAGGNAAFSLAGISFDGR